MVKSAKLNLADADLIAPSAGIIFSRVREVGAIAAAGETVYVLSLTNPVWVRTSEPELGRIRPGMEVQVKTDTPSARTYTGRIAFISTAAEFTPKTVETTELRTSLVYRLRIVTRTHFHTCSFGRGVILQARASTRLTSFLRGRAPARLSIGS